MTSVFQAFFPLSKAYRPLCRCVTTVEIDPEQAFGTSSQMKTETSASDQATYTTHGY
jgi:hypothetical protein